MKSKPRFWTHAQGLVEFALILPVLLLLILGVVEMGRLLAMYSGISSGARQAVRYGSVAGDSDPATAGVQPYYLDCAGIRDTARRASPLLTLDNFEIDIAYDDGVTALPVADCPENLLRTINTWIDPGIGSGDRIKVAITTVYRPLVPIVPIPDLPLTFQAARTIFTSIIGPTPTPACPAPPASAYDGFSSAVASPITQTAGSPITVTVTIKNSKNCVQGNINVTLASTGNPGVITIKPSTYMTPTNALGASTGIATFVLTATVAGTYNFTLSASPGSINKSVSVAYVAGPVDAGTSTVVAASTSLPCDGNTWSNLTITLKDKYNNNVGAGKTVNPLNSSRNWTTTLPFPGPDKVLPPPPLTSNAAGQVSTQVASNTCGSSIYTATATDPTYSVTVPITSSATINYVHGLPSGSFTTVVAQANTVTAGSSTLVVVTLRDDLLPSGTLMTGVSVSLSSSRGGTDTITPASGTTTTPGGQITFTVSSATIGTSSYTATAQGVSGLGSPPANTVTYVAGSVSPIKSTIVASPTSVQADGISTSTITVTLRDGNSQPISGQVVIISSSRGGTDTIAPASVATNASGQAIFTVKSSTQGSSIITVPSLGAVPPAPSATITFITAGANALNSTLIASPTSVQADGSSFSTLVVTLKNSIGGPVAGKTVTITSSRPLSDTITVVGTGVTDANGQATFTVKSSYVGSSIYTAHDTTDVVDVTQTATVNFVCVTGSALGITSGSDQFIQISFTNGTGITRRLSSLAITWPDTPTTRQLNTAHLQGSLIWTGSGDNTSPITLSGSSTPAWDATGNRNINNGFSKTLRLTYNFAVSGSGSFVVVAIWDNGAGGSICTSPTVVVAP